MSGRLRGQPVSERDGPFSVVATSWPRRTKVSAAAAHAPPPHRVDELLVVEWGNGHRRWPPSVRAEPIERDQQDTPPHVGCGLPGVLGGLTDRKLQQQHVRGGQILSHNARSPGAVKDGLYDWSDLLAPVLKTGVAGGRAVN